MLNLPFRMAAKSYEAAYKKYFRGRYDNISHDTTEEQIKQIYNDCANQYDQVTTNFLVISYTNSGSTSVSGKEALSPLEK